MACPSFCFARSGHSKLAFLSRAPCMPAKAQSAKVHLCMNPRQAYLSLPQTSPLPFGSARNRMPRPLAQRPSQQGPACILVLVSTTTSPVLRKQTSPHTVETRPAHLLNGHSHPVTLPPATPRFSAPLPSNRPKRTRSPCFPVNTSLCLHDLGTSQTTFASLHQHLRATPVPRCWSHARPPNRSASAHQRPLLARLHQQL